MKIEFDFSKFRSKSLSWLFFADEPNRGLCSGQYSLSYVVAEILVRYIHSYLVPKCISIALPARLAMTRIHHRLTRSLHVFYPSSLFEARRSFCPLNICGALSCFRPGRASIAAAYDANGPARAHKESSSQIPSNVYHLTVTNTNNNSNKNHQGPKRFTYLQLRENEIYMYTIKIFWLTLEEDEKIFHLLRMLTANKKNENLKHLLIDNFV